MKSFKSIATREEENHAHGKTPAVPRPGPSLLHDPSRAFDIWCSIVTSILFFFQANQLVSLIHTLMLHSRFAHAVSCGRILRNASLRPIRQSWANRSSVYTARTFSSDQVLRAVGTDKLLSEFKENCKTKKKQNLELS